MTAPNDPHNDECCGVCITHVQRVQTNTKYMMRKLTNFIVISYKTLIRSLCTKDWIMAETMVPWISLHFVYDVYTIPWEVQCLCNSCNRFFKPLTKLKMIMRMWYIKGVAIGQLKTDLFIHEWAVSVVTQCMSLYTTDRPHVEWTGRRDLKIDVYVHVTW